ncbi:M48 family metalloprotease [Candidatus Woesearchaeota archaeon]|nr:M48 family metalloprotease [Candidatus Woesearchaeota archaeon]
MIEQLLMWNVYFNNLIHNPISFYALAFSLLASGLFYALFKNSESIRLKINFLAAHVIFLIFPFVFSAFTWKCLMPVMSCSPKMFMLFTPLAGLAAAALGFAALPFLYNWSSRSKVVDAGFMKQLVAEKSKELKIKEPKVYSLNEAMPVAYSITNLKPAIFVSAGLSEALSKKEVEAVLLHELSHHRSRAYFWKFSANLLRMFTPLSMFISASESLEKEEREADKYAVAAQKTGRHLKSAKRKIEKFGKHDR